MKIRSFLALAITGVMLFASCSNNDEIPDQSTGNDGDTWAAFNIKLPKTMETRAADPNASAAETAVNSVAVYLFDANEHLTTSGIKTMAEYGTVNSTDNTISTKIALRTKSGEVKIWVVLNPTDAIHASIMDNISRGNLPFQTAFDAAVSDVTGGISNTTETTSKGFVMVNKAIATKTLASGITNDAAISGKDEAANHFTINVERAVAKVAVISNKADLKDLNTLPELGSFSDIKYSVCQVNPQMYLARYTDKTIQSGGYNIVTPDNNFDGKVSGSPATYWGNKVMDTAPLAVNASGTAKKDLNGIYILENSMITPFQQNATYVLVQAVWTPKVVYQADGSTTGTLAASKDFWYSATTRKYYMEDPTDPQASDAKQWSNGICYYRVYLYDKYTDNTPDADGTRFYDVVRNTCYNVTLNSMHAPGENVPTPAAPGPDPIEEPTYLSVDVNIAAWTFANMDDQDLQ